MDRDASREDLDIRLHGRGGQGTVTLAALLVDAAFRSGWHVLGFPSFGTERTGAPVAAFVRLSGRPIRDRSEVHHPGLVAVQDPTLVDVVDVADGLAPGGIVLVNAEQAPAIPDAEVVARPLTALAVEHLGVPITSTAMLGLIAGVTGIVEVDAACRAVRDRFPGRTGERNEALVRAAHALALAEVTA